MTRVNFPTRYVDTNDRFVFDRLHAAGSRVVSSDDHLSILADLTAVEPEEFDRLNIPGSKIYQNPEAAAARLKAIEQSQRRGLAAAYLISLHWVPVGLCSFMYPDPHPVNIPGRAVKRFMPTRRTHRDFAGWLRTDRLLPEDGETTNQLAKIALEGALELASVASIDTVDVSVDQKLERNPTTKYLVALEAMAVVMGSTFDYIGTFPQRTEGQQFPGKRYSHKTNR